MLSAVPGPVKDAIAKALAPAAIREFSFLAGGCINPAGKLTTSIGHHFIKWNHRTAFPAMFETEAKGLSLLHDSHSVRVSRVVDVGLTDEFQFIILEWIERQERSADYWSLFGQQLAALHRQTSPSFGLDYNNYIGSLPQSNRHQDSWNDFFTYERLEPQIKLATDELKPVETLRKKLEKFYPEIPNLLPIERPSLIHGDLWGGNVLSDENGAPCLIDPAIYYGHREAELSYTRLFDHFDETFYQEYHNTFPVEPGLDRRVDIYNLYPLLVHVNLFGGSYIGQCERIVDRFT